MRSTFVTRDGVRLHVADLGGEGPPLVLVHSTGFGAWMWKPMATELTKHFHVYAPEQRGHGDSDPVGEGYDFANLAEDMEAVFADLGLETFDALAHSSGGTTLLVHAAVRPGRIRRLLLVEPVLGSIPGSGGPNPMAERARRRKPGFESPEAMFESFRGRPPFDTWQEEALRLYCEEGTRPAEGGVVLKCSPEHEARFYEGVGRFDASQYLSKVTIPVLTLLGERSNLPAAAQRGGALSLPGESKSIAGTTHFIPMERPDVVVAEALAFFGEGRA